MIQASLSGRNYGNIKAIRVLIWIYFFLLIFEGSLRMLLPVLSNALLVVRDPFLIAAFLIAHVSQIFPWNRFVVMFWLLGIVLVAVGLALLPGAPLVVAFGFRAAFLHIPLIFLMPNVMDESDVLKIGKCFLLLSVPMAVLMAAQFNAGPDSWLNRGVDMQFKQIDSAGGKIRPPGTFTYTLGTGYFYATTVAFILYDQFHKGHFSKWLVGLSSTATCLALAVCGSRSALGIVAIVIFTAILAVIVAKPKAVTNIVKFAFVISIGLFFASQLSVFSEGIDVFSQRIDSAGRAEGGSEGFISRALGEFVKGFDAIPRAEPAGAGLGMGTNAGSALLIGKATFLLAEGEWDRVVLEMGPFMGFAFLTMRVGLVVWMFLRSLNAARMKSMLPMLLFGSCGFLILTGSWGQPTVLGFAVFIGGLCLAAMPRPQLRRVEAAS